MAIFRKRGYLTTCKTFETKIYAVKWVKEIETKVRQNVFASDETAEQLFLSECLEQDTKR